MKNTLKCLLILLVAAGCATKKDTSKNIEKLIEAKTDACKDTAKCVLNLTEVTTFKWETMYAFNAPQSKEVIEAAIGTKYPGYEEGTRPLIFMSKGEIVYSENNPNGMAADQPGQVLFNYTPTLKFFAFTADKSTFGAKVVKTKGKTFYELFQQ